MVTATGMAMSMRERRGALAAALLLLAQTTPAQTEGGAKRAISFVPHASAAATYTDNALLTDANRRSDLLLALTAGIRMTGQGSRIKAYLDYGLTGQVYTDRSRKNSFQNSLNTFGSVEAVDDFAFLDFNGSVTRQTISAFGVQTDASPISNANQTEVATLRLSPYVRGKLAGSANYEARLSWTGTDTGTAAASDARVADALVKLDGKIPSSPLAWSAEASRQAVKFTTGRATEADRLTGTLNYPVSHQFVVSLTGGRDSNNYTNAGKQSHSVVGAGFNWTPAPTTTVAANASKQSYGQAHSLSFEHRTPLTIWRVSDSKGVSTTPGQLASPGRGPLYDQYFALLAPREPDPIKRAILVDTYLQTVRDQSGLPPAAYLTSAVLLQSRQDVSFVLLGVRDTITLLASRSNSRRLDTLTGAVDDFLNSTVIVQHGFSVGYAHRLTPQSAFNAIASAQRTTGSSAQPDSNLRTVSLSLTTQLGSQSTASFGARRSVFDSSTPYTESALTGSLNVQF